MIQRDVVEKILLEEAFRPGFLNDTAGEQILTDPAYRELGHGALELSARQYPGSTPEAQSGMQGIMLGVALTVAVMTKQAEANHNNV